MRASTASPHASNGQVTDHGELSSRVLRLLRERFDSWCAIEVLNGATDGDIYVFGGTIRRGLFHDKLSGDIDIMVPNGDDRAIDALDALKVPFVLNSNGHRRYRWNSLQIDIFQPREFFRGFEDVESALCFFDLRINALSLHLRSGHILDPFHLVSRTPVTDPGINWSRWRETFPLNVVVLAIRLTKIMHEISELTISTTDGHRLLNEVVPRIRECDWGGVQQRFPAGKQAFLQIFRTKVLDRIRATASDKETRHGR